MTLEGLQKCPCGKNNSFFLMYTLQSSHHTNVEVEDSHHTNVLVNIILLSCISDIITCNESLLESDLYK